VREERHGHVPWVVAQSRIAVEQLDGAPGELQRLLGAS
jgi:hypothetical protein